MRSAGQRDDAFRKFFDARDLDVRGLVGRGFEIECLRKPHQIGEAVRRHREQRDLARRFAARLVAQRSQRRRLRVAVVAEVDIKRAAGDRLHARAPKLVGKFQRAEKVVAVGEAERRKLHRFGELGELGDRQRAFEQRVC